ncbi:MAG: TPM domain-containing protein [Thermodesulfobacteriota bacterium]|nr:TPM domain-containing protein [Thermodesulfobacteriota bacterium]
MLRKVILTRGLFFFLLFQVLYVQAETSPLLFPSRGQPWVNDFANVIDPREEKRIESLCREIQNEGLATIVVCTMESIPKARHEEVKVLSYGADLFDLWELPKEGVLILVSIRDKKTALCTGQLTQQFLPDGDAGEILRKYLLPNFKKGDYGEGCIAGITGARRIMLKNRKVMYPEKYK